jgi:sugar phosphate isomerase/epimerase
MHLTPMLGEGLSNASGLEEALLSQFEEAVRIAGSEGFSFGFEHNDPDLSLYADPARCRWILECVPGLKFVWDSNHIIPEHWRGFESLLPRTQMLHISDTPLPEVNHHLPLGEGNVDWSMVNQMLIDNRFQGPAILEIGGNPKSGGFGRDTDEALIRSFQILRKVLNMEA